MAEPEFAKGCASLIQERARRWVKIGRAIFVLLHRPDGFDLPIVQSFARRAIEFRQLARAVRTDVQHHRLIVDRHHAAAAARETDDRADSQHVDNRTVSIVRPREIRRHYRSVEKTA